MDDLEDLIKLNNILKSEAANTSKASYDEVIVEKINPNKQLCLEDAKDGVLQDVVNIGKDSQEDVSFEVDYSEEIERDVKEAEEHILLEKLECILRSGLELPACVTEAFVSFDKSDLEVIDKCASKELKQLMLLNRTKRRHLVRVLKQIIELLNTTNKIIWQRQQEDNPNLKWTIFKSGSSSLGVPFFKLKNNKVSCWSNPDVERKRQNKELMLYKMMLPIKWTTKDKLLLKKFVGVFYSYTREKELEEKIKNLGDLCNTSDDPESKNIYSAQIVDMKKEIQRLQKGGSNAYPNLNSSDSIDWFEISEHLKGRHSASECKGYWNMFLHPDRKESKWTKSEDNKLIEIAKKYQFQNWEQIAEELGAGRSAFSVCSRYYSHLCTKNYRKDKFQPEEDELLLDIIETCRIGNYIPWSKVSYYFNGRTKNQLYHRYTYYLAQKNTRKCTPFTFEEDGLVMALVERLGKNFSKIAEYVPYRSAMQIKNRYNCYLENPDLIYRPFTIEEDRQILLHAQEHSSSNWGDLAKTINLPRSHVRHRFNTLSKWIASNPDRDLAEVPRRYICRADELNAKFDQLKKITDELRDLEHIPTIMDVKKVMRKMKLCMTKPNTFLRSSVHQQLILYFKTSYKMSRAYGFVTETSTEKDAMIINDILLLLGADLELPNACQLENDPNIDKMDVFLLNHIISKRETDNNARSFLRMPPIQDFIKWSLPPNMGTVVGLRNMIMTISITRSKPVYNSINYNETIEQNLSSLSETEKLLVLMERKKFQQRLYSIFRWPSLMSLTDVSDIQSSCPEVFDIDPRKRPRGRPKKDNARINLRLKKMLEGKEKKKKEQHSAESEDVIHNHYISVREFAKMDSFMHAEDDPDTDNLSEDNCDNTASSDVNIGASTSSSHKFVVSNIPSQDTKDLIVKKTNNARTYKRKRSGAQNDDSKPSKISIVEVDIKPFIKEEEEKSFGF